MVTATGSITGPFASQNLPASTSIIFPPDVGGVLGEVIVRVDVQIPVELQSFTAEEIGCRRVAWYEVSLCCEDCETRHRCGPYTRVTFLHSGGSSEGSRTAVNAIPHLQLEEPYPAPSHARRRQLSALVTTFNEERNIVGCLDSLAFCDEIVVVDSFSTDGTIEILRSRDDVRLLQHRYFGAAAQKNWAIDQLQHDWVLVVDADERVPPMLRHEIETVLAAPKPATAYSIPRTTFVLGRELRYSGWQHDAVVRLFHRRSARYPNRRVHADMITEAPPVSLGASLDHFMVNDVAEYARRLHTYAWWGAAQLYREGRTVGVWEVAVRPVWRFLRTYLLQQGIREGLRGFVMCALPAWSAFLKYATMWSWQQRPSLAAARLPQFDDSPQLWQLPFERDRTP